MRKLIGLGLLLAGLAAAGSAAAHGDVSCPDVPRSERRPTVELQKELQKQGWTVRKLQKFNGCYEVYGYDANGKKVEAFFDPKTFERVRPN
jgi:hypothetical protein